MAKKASSTPAPRFLEINAEKHPDKMAIICSRRSLTYGQLRERARALAAALFALGLRPGNQAALMTYNYTEYLEVSEALNYLQVGLVSVAYKMKRSEINYIVENSDSKILIFLHDFRKEIVPFRDDFNKILPYGLISFGGPEIPGVVDYESLFQEAPELDLDNMPQTEKVGSTMIYTSGTTGRPKGAARKADFIGREGILDHILDLISFLKFDSDEVQLVCCPLYHSAPKLFSLLVSIVGGTLIYQSRFNAVETAKLIDKHKITSVHFVPTMIIRMLNLPIEDFSELCFSSLRSVICGAAPLFPEFKLAFLDRFGPVLFEYYGSTEGGTNTFISPEEMRKRPTSVGKMFTGNDLRILDEQGNEVSDGTPGELYIQNVIMMDEYYSNDKATIECHRDNHITVGDIAIRDADGYYYIVDRVKDMIIRGGVNIYPAEIEGVLITMAGIQDSAVVGKIDKEFGEVVVAFVVKFSGSTISEEDIKNYCIEKMEKHKAPSVVIFIDELPRSPTGKILKKDLRELLQ